VRWCPHQPKGFFRGPVFSSKNPFCHPIITLKLRAPRTSFWVNSSSKFRVCSPPAFIEEKLPVSLLLQEAPLFFLYKDWNATPEKLLCNRVKGTPSQEPFPLHTYPPFYSFERSNEDYCFLCCLLFPHACMFP